MTPNTYFGFYSQSRIRTNRRDYDRLVGPIEILNKWNILTSLWRIRYCTDRSVQPVDDEPLLDRCTEIADQSSKNSIVRDAFRSELYIK